MLAVADQLGRRAAEGYDKQLYSDLFSCIRYLGQTDLPASIKKNHEFLEHIRTAMDASQNVNDKAELYDQYKRALFYSAPYVFDDYLLAVEFDRPLEKKFYQPRRHYLRPMVQGYQDILDGKLDLLTLSLPKRAGKSQVGINFALMLSGRNPDRASLMEGAGDDLITSFYKGCLEYLMDTENYHFYDIFPDAPIIETNAKLKTINLQRKKRFPTIMCRSIDASQVGLSEATNLLYLDDCVQSREEAKNRQRLDDKWETIRGDVMGRAIEGTPIVATGTRYSLYDPIGRLQEYADSQHKRWRAIEIPALDPITDESNYEYVREGKRVFTTAFFREQRELLSAEQFESEFQQQPFEAKGLLFGVKELNYYFELPVDQDPDAIIAVCDTAETGSDSTSLVIARVYGAEVYVVDVVFDDSPADVTKPQCAKALIGNNVGSAVFESNNAGSYYARDIAEMVKQRGYNMSIRTKRTISNKQTRIEFAADGIKKRFFFKHPSTYERGCQYWSFMRELTTYTRSGKVPHDDAPDSLSLLENELRQMIGNQVEIFARPF
nr:MAG TPA: Terminase [Caudoviricetes sp.]